MISYHISKQPSYQLIDIALNQALAVTSDCPYRRTFHSDQGWGYQMRDYVSKLKSHRIFQSMSRKGNCHDNSVMENFFGLLKQEIYYGHIFSSFEELKQVIVIWIRYYNTKRIKQKLNWMSPIQFRLNTKTIKKSKYFYLDKKSNFWGAHQNRQMTITVIFNKLFILVFAPIFRHCLFTNARVETISWIIFLIVLD